MWVIRRPRCQRSPLIVWGVNELEWGGVWLHAAPSSLPSTLPHCQRKLRGTMTLVVVPPPPLRPPPAFYPHSHSHPPRPSFPTIPTSCCFHSVVTWQWWHSMWGAFDVWAVVVTWRRRWVSLASSAAGDLAWLAALAWCRRPSSSVVVGVVGGQ